MLLPFNAIIAIVKAFLNRNLCIIAEVEVSSVAWGSPSEVLVATFVSNKLVVFLNFGRTGIYTNPSDASTHDERLRVVVFSSGVFLCRCVFSSYGILCIDLRI
jgi:hypothetical protein